MCPQVRLPLLRDRGTASRQLFAQTFDFLQQDLELVLGPPELPLEADDVSPAGDAQVRHDQIGGFARD